MDKKGVNTMFDYTNTIKIGTVEFFPEEALKLYSEKKYIVTYSKIFQLFYSQAQGRVYGKEVYCKPKAGVGFARRGRFYAVDAKSVNNLLGFKLLNE